jgi:hypothetical protein
MPTHEIDITRDPSARRRSRMAFLLPSLLAALLCVGCAGEKHVSTSTQTDTAKIKPIEKETYPDIVAAVTACRNGVNKASWLSPQNKEVLDETCNRGLRRGLTEVKEYALEACHEVSYTSPAKSATERARVLDECYAETKLKTITDFSKR